LVESENANPELKKAVRGGRIGGRKDRRRGTPVFAFTKSTMISDSISDASFGDITSLMNPSVLRK